MSMPAQFQATPRRHRPFPVPRVLQSGSVVQRGLWFHAVCRRLLRRAAMLRIAGDGGSLRALFLALSDGAGAVATVALFMSHRQTWRFYWQIEAHAAFSASSTTTLSSLCVSPIPSTVLSGVASMGPQRKLSTSLPSTCTWPWTFAM